MGKREVRTVVVRKWVTFTFLILVSAGMVALLYFLSGKAYAPESHPIRDLLFAGNRPLPRPALLAGFMPVIANVLLFVPWGFLMFLILDRPERPRGRAYALTVATGLLFALALQVWQVAFPTRVTAWADALANAAGTFIGAAGGHLRKRYYIRFEF
jgi:VanZ family protein